MDKAADTLAAPDTSQLRDGRNGAFATTHWSVVLAAGGLDAARSAPALEQLCGRYWYPINAFIRRRNFDRQEAEDLTQMFFASLLDHEAFKQVHPHKGKFRAFLLASLGNFLANDWDKRRALKRGGQFRLVSFEEAAAEDRYGLEPVEPASPEKLFDRRWAFMLVEAVLARLKAEYAAADKTNLFAKLEPGLAGESGPGWLAGLAMELAMSEGALRVALHRLRRRFGELLRDEVAQTVTSAAEVNEEIRGLFAAMSA